MTAGNVTQAYPRGIRGASRGGLSRWAAESSCGANPGPGTPASAARPGEVPVGNSPVCRPSANHFFRTTSDVGESHATSARPNREAATRQATIIAPHGEPRQAGVPNDLVMSRSNSSNAPAGRPNFFLIGAPKCGTTALSEYLRTHPSVFVTEPKEPNFFNRDFDYYDCRDPDSIESM